MILRRIEKGGEEGGEEEGEKEKAGKVKVKKIGEGEHEGEEGVEVGGEWVGKEEVKATEIKSRVKLVRQSDCLNSKHTAT